MPELASNNDLYEYMASLHRLIVDRGALVSAKFIQSAMMQATGLSTEFLGESRNALEKVLIEENETLTLKEQEELHNVISQLNSALRRERTKK